MGRLLGGRPTAYATSAWRQGTNPTPTKLLELVNRFDTNWGAELQALFDDDDELIERSIRNLVATRNRVAHGSSEQVRVRPALEFASHAELLGAWFIGRFDPTQ